ncbi:hypothetical protein PINS_up010297 [Pythium insidiosum]|nr:hypothetical protein PINS_up010297 [Pythium insidiosum]
MRVDIDGLEVLFPYERMYPEQLQYMRELKRALDAQGHCMLEMPTGTGKTVSLLSLVLAYKHAHPTAGKLVYCTRTVPEMTKCVAELKQLVAYRAKYYGEAASRLTAVCLSSRRNMCVHPRVMAHADGEAVDGQCRRMTASWVRARAKGVAEPAPTTATTSDSAAPQTQDVELCSYFENYESRKSDETVLPAGVYSIDDLKAQGVTKGWCPYFLTRYVVSFADVIVFNYQYLLDPKAIAMETKPMKYCFTRLNSLLRTLEITNLEDYTALTDVADFATLVATYADGFMLILEPVDGGGVPDPVLQLACLDASLAMRPVFERFASVVITSGTLSPIELYPRLLNFHPVVRESLPMSVYRSCICPLVITRGSDQMPVSTKFDLRDDMSVVRNYGTLLLEMAASCPDGMVCFFPSYLYMEKIIGQWDTLGVLKRVLLHKLLFIETKDIVETTLALDNYKKACDCGRGAVFFSVARGKVAEGIDFDRHYGRCVLLFGIPFQYTLSHKLRARLEYLRYTHQIREGDFLTFDALRQAAQCAGRVLRSKTDYGLVLFADSRYNRLDKRSKLPPWITQFLVDSHLNLSVDMAIFMAKKYLTLMAQPVDDSANVNSILLDADGVAAWLGRHQANANGSKATTTDAMEM